MRHSEKLQLSERLTKAIIIGSNEIRTIFIGELSNSKEIKSILESYDYLNESKGKVYEFEIQPDSITICPNGEGSFKVTYALEFFYACDAITTKHKQEMNLILKLDLNTSLALFSGEDVPEREPDDF